MQALTRWLLLVTFTFWLLPVIAQKEKKEPVYYPEPNAWLTKTPESVGMNALKIQEAITFAKEKESKTPRNLEEAHYQSFGKEPFGDAIGPLAERGAATGMIVRNGYIVGGWGDPQRGSAAR